MGKNIFIHQDNQTQHWWGKKKDRRFFSHRSQRVAAANFSKKGRKKERKQVRERAKREGRGADTSSCGAIALQRKCDTFPIVSLRTTELPLDRKGWEGETGRWDTDGQLRMNLRIHGPRSPPHTHYMPASSLSPSRLPSLIYPSIHRVIAVTVTGYNRQHGSTCTYIPSPYGIYLLLYCKSTSVHVGTVLH